MNLITNKVLSTVVPSLLVGGLLVETPPTMSTHNLADNISAKTVSCKSFIDSRYCELMKKIESYQYLNENWDGYGGKAPKEEVIGFAIGIIQELQKHQISAPKAMVSGHGEIALFWKRQNQYIEISLEENHQSSYFVKNENKIYGEEDCFIDYKIPKMLIGGLATKNAKNTMGASDRLYTTIRSTESTNHTFFLTA